MGRKKVSIIGAGRVGSTAALLCAMKSLGDIVLVDAVQGRAEGMALDISHSSPVNGFEANVTGTTDFGQTKNSDIIVIAAGFPRKEGMGRDDLLKTNAEIIKNVIGKAATLSKNAIIIVVTNPLDAMAYLAKEVSHFPKQRVVGMGGILDSSRLRFFIAEKTGLPVREIEAMVIGSHGDSMVPLLSHARIKGKPLEEFLSTPEIEKLAGRTREAGAEIVSLQKDSSAFVAPAAAITEMVESVARNKKKTLPCSAYLEGEYGVEGIFMGVPVVLGSGGVEKILELELTGEELAALVKSARDIKELVRGL